MTTVYVTITSEQAPKFTSPPQLKIETNIEGCAHRELPKYKKCDL